MQSTERQYSKQMLFHRILLPHCCFSITILTRQIIWIQMKLKTTCNTSKSVHGLLWAVIPVKDPISSKIFGSGCLTRMSLHWRECRRDSAGSCLVWRTFKRIKWIGWAWNTGAEMTRHKYTNISRGIERAGNQNIFHSGRSLTNKRPYV